MPTASGRVVPSSRQASSPARGTGRSGQPWTATTWALNDLRDWGLQAAALAGTAEKLAANSRWDYNDGPYWEGEVDCCINSWTLSNGVWLGADVAGLAQWFLDHQLADGGWNCEWENGSVRSSFHSTLNSLRGLLDYEIAIGGTTQNRAGPTPWRGVPARAHLIRRSRAASSLGPG